MALPCKRTGGRALCRTVEAHMGGATVTVEAHGAVLYCRSRGGVAAKQRHRREAHGGVLCAAEAHGGVLCAVSRARFG